MGHTIIIDMRRNLMLKEVRNHTQETESSPGWFTLGLALDHSVINLFPTLCLMWNSGILLLWANKTHSTCSVLFFSFPWLWWDGGALQLLLIYLMGKNITEPWYHFPSYNIKKESLSPISSYSFTSGNNTQTIPAQPKQASYPKWALETVLGVTLILHMLDNHSTTEPHSLPTIFFLIV